MKNDLIFKYMNYKSKKLKEYIYIIDNNKLDKKIVEPYLNSYINTYINTYYYHILETLDYSELVNYNSKDIYKELEGKYYEIIYDIENSEILDSNDIYLLKKKQAKYCFQLTLFISYIDTSRLFLEEDYEKYTIILDQICNKNKFINQLIDAFKYQELFEALSFERKKTNQFMNLQNSLKFELNYNKYQELEYYYISLKYNISRLNNYYRNDMVERVYNFKNVSIFRVKTMINLLISDILKRTIYAKNIAKYFILLNKYDLDNKKQVEAIFDMVKNPLLKNNIVFLLNYNDYISHTKIVSNHSKYNFGLLCDLSHSNDIDKKLDILDNLPVIKYIILDKIKKSSFEIINKYDFKKEAFYNKYEKE